MNKIEYISEHPEYPIESLSFDHRPLIAFNDLGISKPVLVILLSDDELLEINKQSLNHDYYTDIITFDYSDDDDLECSELCISLDRVVENAEQLNTPFVEELHRVIIHGLLHLAGHDDQTNEQKKKMRSMEDRFLDLQRST